MNAQRESMQNLIAFPATLSAVYAEIRSEGMTATALKDMRTSQRQTQNGKAV